MSIAVLKTKWNKINSLNQALNQNYCSFKARPSKIFAKKLRTIDEIPEESGGEKKKKKKKKKKRKVGAKIDLSQRDWERERERRTHRSELQIVDQMDERLSKGEIPRVADQSADRMEWYLGYVSNTIEEEKKREERKEERGENEGVKERRRRKKKKKKKKKEVAASKPGRRRTPLYTYTF